MRVEIRFRRNILAGVAAAALLATGLPANALAATHHHRHHSRHHHHYSMAAPPYSALVVNADNGHVLYQKNAHGLRYPASLTKMMTLYLTFDALKHGKLDMDQRVPVSAKAAGMPQTNIGLERGSHIPVKKAIESLVVRSANDSAVVLAEAVGGTTWNFALEMTKKAHELGMDNTVFRNPNGLPDNRQHTTALDMAKLAIALRRDFPEYYHFFSMESFDYDGVTYPGHNHVMERYPDMVDGIKTGYIRAAGFNLVTSAHHDGHNIVAVILGGPTAARRDEQMVSLIDRGFEQLGATGLASREHDMSSVTLSESRHGFKYGG